MFKLENVARDCIMKSDKYIPGKPVEEVEREYGVSDSIKLASNENPFGASLVAFKAMVKELTTHSHLYPESSSFKLKMALAEKHAVDPGMILVDNGLDGVINTFGMTFIDPGDKVVTSDITFPAYKNITTKMNGKLIAVPAADDLGFDIDGILEAAGSDAKIIFLCNPNNPTGNMIGKADFERIMKAVPETTLVVSDEAYFEFAVDEEYPDTISYLNEYPNLVVLRTFSKIMGLAGIRVGYMIADADIVEIMMKARLPFPVNRIAEAGALASLTDQEFIERVVTHTVSERIWLKEQLEAMGMTAEESHTNFLFVKLNRPMGTLYEDLLRKGIILRPVAYNGADYFRITIGTAEENRILLDGLKDILG